MKRSIIIDDELGRDLQERANRADDSFSKFCARILKAWMIREKIQEEQEREEK